MKKNIYVTLLTGNMQVNFVKSASQKNWNIGLMLILRSSKAKTEQWDQNLEPVLKSMKVDYEYIDYSDIDTHAHFIEKIIEKISESRFDEYSIVFNTTGGQRLHSHWLDDAMLILSDTYPTRYISSIYVDFASRCLHTRRYKKLGDKIDLHIPTERRSYKTVLTLENVLQLFGKQIFKESTVAFADDQLYEVEFHDLYLDFYDTKEFRQLLFFSDNNELKNQLRSKSLDWFEKSLAPAGGKKVYNKFIGSLNLQQRGISYSLTDDDRKRLLNLQLENFEQQLTDVNSVERLNLNRIFVAEDLSVDGDEIDIMLFQTKLSKASELYDKFGGFPDEYKRIGYYFEKYVQRLFIKFIDEHANVQAHIKEVQFNVSTGTVGKKEEEQEHDILVLTQFGSVISLDAKASYISNKETEKRNFRLTASAGDKTTFVNVFPVVHKEDGTIGPRYCYHAMRDLEQSGKNFIYIDFDPTYELKIDNKKSEFGIRFSEMEEWLLKR